MFKHADGPEEKNISGNVEPVNSDGGVVPVSPAVEKTVDLVELKSLIEKNLKWSQIIYEQNRKINRNLFWKAVVSWLWFVVLVVLPAIGGVWAYENRGELMKKYEEVITKMVSDSMGSSFGITPANNSYKVDDLMKVLPLNDDQKEQFKSMLSN